MGFWSEFTAFFRAFRENFHDTGAILPSSRFLARALAVKLRGPRPPARILEVGPGTGPVTREIVRLMRPDDRLDAVEINPTFVELLRKRLAEDPFLRKRAHQVELIQSGVEDLNGNAKYDYIISGLPLNNFQASHVRLIFRTFARLLKPGGTLSYYEYALVRQLKSPFVGSAERRRLRRVGRVVDRYIREYQTGLRFVFMNLPPAKVRYLQFTPTNGHAATNGH